MLNETEIETKYKIINIGKQHYYRYDLGNLDYSLETTTPLSLEIEGKSFLETSWKQLLIVVCTKFLKEQPEKSADLLAYWTPWSHKKVFFNTQEKNCYSIGNNTYLLCTLSALHACILLRDILIIFGCDPSKSIFVIFRPPYAEPKECREFYEKKTINAFKYYWTNLLKNSIESFDKIIRNISSLNKYLAKCSQAYDNFFLIQNNATYSSYKSKLLTYLRFEAGMQSNLVLLANKYLTILENFYKTFR